MKILYLSHHSILEYDEVKLFNELGYDIFSWGAYTHPEGHPSLPRPGIENLKYYPEYAELADHGDKMHIPDALIDAFDVIIFMHLPDELLSNWERIKHKRVIWRTIGQSLPKLEFKMQKLVAEGLQIVRYSPVEKRMDNFAGESAMIRFYKDPLEFGDWNGQNKTLINFTQNLKGRADFCHYDEIRFLMDGYNSKIYGVENEGLGELSGGEASFDQLKQLMRDSRVYIYGGTWPASYTLSFIEAWMTGIPVIAIGKTLASTGRQSFDFYEVAEIIENGVTGFCSDNLNDLRTHIKQLIDNKSFADKISQEARTKAMAIFGKETIKNLWKEFLNK